MKTSNNTLKFILATLAIIVFNMANAQTCTVQGDESTYGTSNTWIGYVYRGANFNIYKGYVTEGSASSPNFDENFGGDRVQYATNGCSVYTDTFSVRYKLTKTFTDGDYIFTTGGDDGYRLSTDGGATWAINNWADHSYNTSTATIHLNGTYNLVFEYYERYINNRVTFNLQAPCASGENTAAYGAESWIGYVYSGMNFSTYKGSYTEGNSTNPNFDQNFGGDNTTFNTSGCAITTANFSVRYRMSKTLTAGTYLITVGADDGYRLSLDGGATYVITKWADQGYNTTTYTATLSGTYNMVLDYYENGGGNRVSFSMSMATLPVRLISFNGKVSNTNKAELVWKCDNAENFSHFTVQKSTDGRVFEDVNTIVPKTDYASVKTYAYTDITPLTGTNYYRLAMVDRDETVAYSTVIVLSVKSLSAARVYPTVVEGGSIYVETGSATGQVKLEVYDMNGRLIMGRALTNGRQQVSLQVKNAGTYVARISGSKENILSQMIVVR
ncbi:MAG: T9SS type A sorting domain-containing protein [Chitinophagaceae bacterium]|nr:T9SS type A sorting domain-containing protein [Chitinophagaceae bacterium]